MVAPHPNLSRKFRNTDNIVRANKSNIVPNLYARYPEDYVDIQTHNIIHKTMPWAEVQSPLAKEMFGIMSDSISDPKYLQFLQPIIIDKILVLCVDFPDKPAEIPIETIYQRFFGNYTNSLKEYYKEVSYSKYIPHGVVYGWYRAPNPSTYYTNKENGFGKYPNSAEKLVEDIVDIASTDPDIDWASFDTNDNGYIDNLFVVHSGAEAAYTGNIDDFWAHVYVIPQPKIIYSSKDIQGRIVWIYALVSEYLEKPTDPIIIGGDCHEHGHQLGLPDLYDYTDQSNGVGVYSLMGAGSWGNVGQTPTHLDAWSKYVLGFTETIEDPIGTIYLDNTEIYPNNVKYTTDDHKEYFLVENRQKMLYDKYLPSEGLFIWHINEHQIDNNVYNDDKSCYLVGLIQSDNLKDLENRANNGDLGDSFPGITENRFFGKFTNPNSILCNGQLQSLLLSNISDPGTTMSFESSIPGPLQPSPITSPVPTIQAGLNPAQTLILTGLATGAILHTPHTSE